LADGSAEKKKVLCGDSRGALGLGQHRKMAHYGRGRIKANGGGGEFNYDIL
jgi:hypothetical protein